MKFQPLTSKLIFIIFLIMLSTGSIVAQSSFSNLQANKTNNLSTKHPFKDNSLVSLDLSNTTSSPAKVPTNYFEPFSTKIGPKGNIYITGDYEVSLKNIDVFVLKMSPNGSIIFKTHFGGSSTDIARDIVIDKDGNSYISGYTDSKDFFTTNAFQPSSLGGYDIFLTKLSPSGNIIYSTYLGSYGDDFVRGLSINSYDQLVLASYSNSPLNKQLTQLDFSKSNKAIKTHNFYPLIYLIHLNGTPIINKAYYENISYNTQGIALYNNSNIVLVGGTFIGNHFGTFIKIINGTSLQVIKNLIFDEGPFSWPFSAIVDRNNKIWVGGITNAQNITSPSGVSYTHKGGKYDLYLVSINTSYDLDNILMFGGPGDDIMSWLSVDSNNNVVFTGRTDSKTFIGINQSIIMNDIKNPDGTNIFAGEVNSSGSFQFIRFLGGELDDSAKSIAVNQQTHEIYVTGSTTSIQEFNLPFDNQKSLLLIKLDSNADIVYQKAVYYLFPQQKPYFNQLLDSIFPYAVLVIDLLVSAFITWKIHSYFKKKNNGNTK